MASSTFSGAYEPQQESDSPFLSETIFTDEAIVQVEQARRGHPVKLALESPFLQEFEQERKKTISEDSSYSEPADELEEPDFDREIEGETFDFLASEKNDFEHAFLTGEFSSELSEGDEKKLASALDDAQNRFSMPGLNALRPRRILGKLERDRKKVTQHLTNTVELFDTTTRIKPDEIDWPLVQIIAAREIGMTSMALRRIYSSNSNRLINSAGKDTHVDGKGGFDNLYKFHPFFPKKVQKVLKSVRTDRCKNSVNPHKEPGFRKGRYNTCPALIPEKYLLAGAVVNVTGSQRGFSKQVRRIFDDPEPLLASLNRDAKRIWTALTFARPGGSSSPDGQWGIITILHDYKRQLEEGNISDLNAIANDTTLRKKRPFVMRAAIASAQTSILEKSLPNHIAVIFDSSPSIRRPTDYSCIRPQVLNRELGQFELDVDWATEFEAESTACFYLPISSQPIPCKFYTIKYKVDARGLIDLAGRAYGVKHYREKLKLAQWMNNHSYNQRFWRKGKASKSFQSGRISFNPRFSRDINQQSNATGLAPRGNAFATIFIPPPPDWLGKTFSSCTRLEIESEIDQEDFTSEFWALEEELESELALEQPYRFENDESFLEEIDEEMDNAESSEIEDDFDDEILSEDEWEDEVLEDEGRSKFKWEVNPRLDVNKAAQYNQKYMASIGWQPYIDDIIKLLGFSTYTPDANTFAQAVANWQQQKGLNPDGKIGPKTWIKIRGLLKPKPNSSPPYGNTEVGRIENRTAFSPSDKRQKLQRGKVYALVLHQMAFSRGNDVKKYDRVTAHFIITPDGKIAQLHPISAYLFASNGFNKHSIAVEFAGNFRNIHGKCWKPEKFGCHDLTSAQVEAGRYLIRYLKKEIELTHVLAHRQSSDSRTNDPGPDIWSRLGQWAVNDLGLNDGGAGFKIGNGKPIPDTWRTWESE